MNAHLGTLFSADTPWQVINFLKDFYWFFVPCQQVQDVMANGDFCRIFLKKLFYLMSEPKILILKKSGLMMSPTIMIMTLTEMNTIAVTDVAWRTFILIRKLVRAAHVVHWKARFFRNLDFPQVEVLCQVKLLPCIRRVSQNLTIMKSLPVPESDVLLITKSSMM